MIVIVAIISYFILPISIPLIVAFISALFLEPLVKLIKNKLKVKRRISVLIVFLAFVCFIGISGYFITTKVVTEAIKLVEHAPQYINEFTAAWLKIEADFSTAAKDLPKELVDEISTQIQTFLYKTKNDLIAYVNINNVKALLTNIPNYLVSFIVYLIALFLFMIDIPRIREMIYNHLTDKTAEKVTFMISRLKHVVMGFFKAQLLVSIIIFVVALIGLLIIAPDVALVMSLVVWIIDVIPIIGSIVILGP